MINTVDYQVNLYYNGTIIGNCRKLAQNLIWTRRRTKMGVDSIDFTINDVLLARWLEERGTSLSEILKPYALECRIVRDGIPILGGFMATMPAYSPRGTSADLEMRFDGYMNFLAGVYIYPIGTVTGRMGALAKQYIDMANTRASNAGKTFGLVSGTISIMNTVTHTFDNYKTVKDWLGDRCDNTTGAGPFDVYFHPDKTYDVIKDSDFGTVITDWVANYPADINATSATSIKAPEISSFASKVIALGAGEVSAVAAENTVIKSEQTNSTAVTTYGYKEELIQESSITQQTTLNQTALTELYIVSNPIWEPQITLDGRLIAPKPSGAHKIWIGDTITIDNAEDLTGMTNGQFRVNELAVRVSAAGDETITPTLERVV